MDGVKMVLPTWNNVAMLGVYSILKIKDELPEAYSEKKRIMKATVITLADKYVNHAHKSIFATAMGSEKSDFVWGSNSNAANQGILLLYAFHYTREKKYFDAANANADYLLGRNATGYSFVTGFGAKTPMHPHHRPSIADGIVEPVPGLLVGGPNPFMQDKCIYKSTEVENAYTDDDCSYASNEIAINWNAPAVYLFNAIQAFMKEQRIDDKTETLITTKRKS